MKAFGCRPARSRAFFDLRCISMVWNGTFLRWWSAKDNEKSKSFVESCLRILMQFCKPQKIHGWMFSCIVLAGSPALSSRIRAQENCQVRFSRPSKRIGMSHPAIRTSGAAHFLIWGILAWYGTLLLSAGLPKAMKSQSQLLRAACVYWCVS